MTSPSVKNKRIAILGTRGIPAAYGGFETFAEELSTRLTQLGMFDVTVFCNTANPFNQQTYNGVKLINIPPLDIGPLNTLLYDLRSLYRARRSFDVVYMLGYGAGIFFVLLKLWKTKLWVNMDGIEWKRSKWPWYVKMYLKLSERFAVKLANIIIADAEAIKDYLIRQYGDSDKYKVIAYGTSVTETPPHPHQLSAFKLTPYNYYIIVCRLEPENHVYEIIQGYLRANTENMLVIVGDYKLNTDYVRMLLANNNPKIVFLGALYEKDLLRTLRYYATGYIHGHSVGGTNPSLLEAMGCGNYIIAHDNEFNREVSGNLAEYFITPENISFYINKIDKITRNERALHTNSEIAYVKQRYSWDTIVGQYIQAIGEIR